MINVFKDGKMVKMTEAEYGIPPFQPTEDLFRAAIAEVVERTARERRYDSSVSCASYVNSTVPSWAAEAQAFVVWRDAVWAHAYTEMGKINGGQREVPTIEELLAELPAMEWPE